MIEEPEAEHEAPGELTGLSTVEPAVVATSPSDFSSDAWRLPLSLRMVAFLFILVGVLRVLETILQLAMYGRLHANVFLALASLLIGYGLRRWNNTARCIALLVTWLYLIGGMGGLAFVVLMWASELGLNMGEQVGGWRGRTGLVVTGFAVSIAYCIWQLRVLQRPKIVRRFKMARTVSIGARPRWQFSLGSLLLAMIVAAFGLARMNVLDVWHETQHVTERVLPNIRRPDGTFADRLFQYGVRRSRIGRSREELIYVVLEKTEAAGAGWDFTLPGIRTREVTFRSPSGKLIELPGKHQLFETGDGHFATRDERVNFARATRLHRDRS